MTTPEAARSDLVEAADAELSPIADKYGIELEHAEEQGMLKVGPDGTPTRKLFIIRGTTREQWVFWFRWFKSPQLYPETAGRRVAVTGSQISGQLGRALARALASATAESCL